MNEVHTRFRVGDIVTYTDDYRYFALTTGKDYVVDDNYTNNDGDHLVVIINDVGVSNEYFEYRFELNIKRMRKEKLERCLR